jgi:HK97 family phage major capsid protein
VPFDNIISRADADALIPEEVASEVIQTATQSSAALELCRRATMSTKTRQLPVLSALPVAFWVQGDTGLKQTTEAAWAGVILTAEELAAIVPVPEAVLADADFDVWSELRGPIAEAVALKIDQAVFAGVDKPASWPPALVPAAQAAGNVELIDSTAAQGGIYGDVESAIGLVETDGFDPTGVAARGDFKRLVRSARSAAGDLLGEGSTTSVWDLPVRYMLPGVLADPVRAVVGDFSLAVVGVRQDLTYKLLTEAVITDDTGKIIYNLAQQDMVALRVTMRVAYATGVPVTRAGSGASVFPFATLQNPGA